MTYSIETRLSERRARKTIAEWTIETEEKIRNWSDLSDHERGLLRTSAMNELYDIVELGLERSRLKLENR